MAEKNIGKITQIIGAVLDIKFSEGNLPEINEAINIPIDESGKKLVVGKMYCHGSYGRFGPWNGCTSNRGFHQYSGW